MSIQHSYKAQTAFTFLTYTSSCFALGDELNTTSFSVQNNSACHRDSLKQTVVHGIGYPLLNKHFYSITFSSRLLL